MKIFGLLFLMTVMIVGVLATAVATHRPSSKSCYLQSILDAKRLVENGRSKLGVQATATILSIERDCGKYD